LLHWKRYHRARNALDNQQRRFHPQGCRARWRLKPEGCAFGRFATIANGLCHVCRQFELAKASLFLLLKHVLSVAPGETRDASEVGFFYDTRAVAATRSSEICFLT
jgi:hypothetical protein